MLNKHFNILPSKRTPMAPPIAIGSKKDKLFLKFFNNPKQASINLSYIPVITQMTPLLTPGSMAPAPINIPTKKILIFFKVTTSI